MTNTNYKNSVFTVSISSSKSWFLFWYRKHWIFASILGTHGGRMRACKIEQTCTGTAGNAEISEYAIFWVFWPHHIPFAFLLCQFICYSGVEVDLDENWRVFSLKKLEVRNLDACCIFLRWKKLECIRWNQRIHHVSLVLISDNSL
jgi:hypothetical protein